MKFLTMKGVVLLEYELIWYVVAILALLLYLIPVWFITKKLLNKYTNIDTELILVKITMVFSTFEIGYDLLYGTIKSLIFTLSYLH